MTVDNELIRLGDSVIHNKAARLWLPEYIMPEFVNSEIPSEADLFTASTVQLYPIGAQLAMNANLWRYILAGEALWMFGYLKGNYTQCPGKAGNSVHSGFEGGFYAAVVAEDTSFQIADTAALKNEYAGALLAIFDSTNGFQQYRVIGNDASTGVYTTCYIGEPGFKAAAAASGGPGIDVYLNPYRNIREVNAKGGYMSALGMVRFTVASESFAWMITAGPTACGAGWPGTTQFYRGVYDDGTGYLAEYSAGKQRVGYLLERTASDYGDNHFMMELDREGAV